MKDLSTFTPTKPTPYYLAPVRPLPTLKCGSGRALPTEVMQSISNAGILHVFGRGDLIPKSLFGANYIFTISCGCLGIYKNKTEGRKQITHLAFNDSIIGFTRRDFYNFDAIALDHTEILVFSEDMYRNEVSKNAEFSGYVIDCLESELKDSQLHTYLAGRLSSVEAVAAFILYLKEKQRDAISKLGTYDLIPLPLSRSDFADYLGLTFETVSRAISVLKKRKLISCTDAKSILLHDEKLLKKVFQI